MALSLSAPCPASDWSQVARSGIRLHYSRDSGPVLADHVLDVLVEGRSEVARSLGGLVQVPIEAYLAQTSEQFHELSNHRVPHWGAGVAFPDSRTLVLRSLPGQSDELVQTARHELSHILLHAAVSKTAVRIPVWFNEGVAMWVAHEWRFHQSFEVLVAALGSGVLPLAEIESVLSFGSARAHLAYTESLLAVLLLVELGGHGAIPDMVDALSRGVSFDVALFQTTGMTPSAFESEFQCYVGRRFGPWAVLTPPDAIWLAVSLMILLCYVAIRFRNRARTAAWEDEDPLDALPLKLRLKVRRARRSGESRDEH